MAQEIKSFDTLLREEAMHDALHQLQLCSVLRHIHRFAPFAFV